MASSIVRGIQKSRAEQEPSQSNDGVAVIKVLATTSTQASTERLRPTFSAMGENLSVSCGSNTDVMRQASVVILGCKPHMVQGMLQAEGVSQALAGKLVISILAGTPVSVLRQYFYGGLVSSEEMVSTRCIVRAIPNLGAHVNASTHQ
jgi:pyrroline-5-carboxylate reductase